MPTGFTLIGGERSVSQNGITIRKSEANANVCLRSQIVVEYARALFNDTVAEVLDVVLEIADDSIVEMSDERSSEFRSYLTSAKY